MVSKSESPGGVSMNRDRAITPSVHIPLGCATLHGPFCLRIEQVPSRGHVVKQRANAVPQNAAGHFRSTPLKHDQRPYRTR